MGGPFQISSQGSVGHVSDTETVQNEWLDESQNLQFYPAVTPPVERSLLGLVELAHQTPVLLTAVLAIAKAVVHPEESAVPPAIHLQDPAPWLVETDSTDSVQHNRVKVENCQFEQQRDVDVSILQCTKFALASWDPRTTQNPEGSRAMPGNNRGNWHVSCAILP